MPHSTHGLLRPIGKAMCGIVHGSIRGLQVNGVLTEPEYDEFRKALPPGVRLAQLRYMLGSAIGARLASRGEGWTRTSEQVDSLVRLIGGETAAAQLEAAYVGFDAAAPGMPNSGRLALGIRLFRQERIEVDKQIHSFSHAFDCDHLLIRLLPNLVQVAGRRPALLAAAAATELISNTAKLFQGGGDASKIPFFEKAISPLFLHQLWAQAAGGEAAGAADAGAGDAAAAAAAAAGDQFSAEAAEVMYTNMLIRAAFFYKGVSRSDAWRMLVEARLRALQACGGVAGLQTLPCTSRAVGGMPRSWWHTQLATHDSVLDIALTYGPEVVLWVIATTLVELGFARLRRLGNGMYESQSARDFEGAQRRVALVAREGSKPVAERASGAHLPSDRGLDRYWRGQCAYEIVRPEESTDFAARTANEMLALAARLGRQRQLFSVSWRRRLRRVDVIHRVVQESTNTGGRIVRLADGCDMSPAASEAQTPAAPSTVWLCVAFALSCMRACEARSRCAGRRTGKKHKPGPLRASSRIGSAGSGVGASTAEASTSCLGPPARLRGVGARAQAGRHGAMVLIGDKRVTTSSQRKRACSARRCGHGWLSCCPPAPTARPACSASWRAAEALLGYNCTSKFS